jgi:hypothetical protein
MKSGDVVFSRWPIPRVAGLFEKRIEGDDALLELARLRFEQAGMGAECYGESPEQVPWLLSFAPSSPEGTFLHLPRDADILTESGRARVMEFAGRGAEGLGALVLHDQPECATQAARYVEAVRAVSRELEAMDAAVLLFIEYASGLEPEAYLELFHGLRDTPSVSACVDIGHVGLRQARAQYGKGHPGEDLCGLRPDDPLLIDVVDEVEEAVRSALPVVLSMVRALSAYGKPIHFHLHDAHPLYAESPFGVSDHLSFLAAVPIPFAYKGRRSLTPMYGPSGLSEIIRTSLRAMWPEGLSFTLEIHPSGGRVPLGDARPLFGHWRDLTNAERMNHWLGVLTENVNLLSSLICQAPLYKTTAQGE